MNGNVDESAEERRPYLEATTAPPAAATAPKKRRRAPATPRGGGGGGGGNGVSASVFSDRMQKLLEKQRAAAVRETERVVQRMLDAHTDATLPAARTEAEAARQHCAALLQEHNARFKGAAAVASEVGEYTKLVARLRRVGDTTTSAGDAALLEQCAVALTQQSIEIATLQRTLNNLMAAYGDNAAKCDAVVRRTVAGMAAPAAVATMAGPAAVAAASPAESGSGGLFIRTGTDGRGAYSVSTRNARQVQRGAPGSHYLAVSLARESGGVQMRYESEATRHADAVQRQRIEAEHEQVFAALVDPSALMRLELRRAEAEQARPRITAAADADDDSGN